MAGDDLGGQNSAPFRQLIRWAAKKIGVILSISSVISPFLIGFYAILDSNNYESRLVLFLFTFWLSVPIVGIYAIFAFSALVFEEELEAALRGERVLSYRYAKKHFMKSLFGFAILFVFSSVYYFIKGDISVVFGLISYLILCFGYSLILFIRIARGYFADNSTEVSEIVAYLYEMCTQAGRPPGPMRPAPVRLDARESADQMSKRGSRTGANGRLT